MWRRGTAFTLDKELNITRLPSHVITRKRYKLFKMVRFLAHHVEIVYAYVVFSDTVVLEVPFVKISTTPVCHRHNV